MKILQYILVLFFIPLAGCDKDELTQISSLYPNYNTSPLPPDSKRMSSNAFQLAAKIKLGWNMGNSLEAIGGETAWGNPRASKALSI